jgi:hypothetical protein
MRFSVFHEMGQGGFATQTPINQTLGLTVYCSRIRPNPFARSP